MRPSWGKFTVRGSEALDSAIAGLVEKVGKVVEEAVPRDRYQALILIGGYGRGEGGVVVRNGMERPHNNLDFLLLTENLKADAAGRLVKNLRMRLAALEQDLGISIEISSVPASKLRHSPCLVMWYDMRFGHKTVLGDPQFVPSLSRYSVERILPEDINWLLVNRGSQIIFNDLLIERGALSDEERQLVVKQAMKAIIGYGDALLFFLGGYHWSYQEKNRRMARRNDVPESFRNLYAAAMEFRFQPQYDEYLHRDLDAWMREIRESCEKVHIECESRRMRARNWTWEEYPSLCLRHALRANPLALRATAKKLINICRGLVSGARANWQDGLAYRAAGPRGLLPACYPAVVYGLECPPLLHWTQNALGARDASRNELRRAFLRQWGHLVDPSFFKVVDRLGLDLDSRDPNL